MTLNYSISKEIPLGLVQVLLDFTNSKLDEIKGGFAIYDGKTHSMNIKITINISPDFLLSFGSLLGMEEVELAQLALRKN